jgi:cytochrome c peroxidase
MAKPADAVKAADEAMALIGWQRNGARWTKAGGQAAPAGAPPKAAIDKLKSDPKLKDAFDQKYGKGAADAALGK